MKIIEMGKLPESDIHLFKCDYCGCIFEATTRECYDMDTGMYTRCPICDTMCRDEKKGDK